MFGCLVKRCGLQIPWGIRPPTFYSALVRPFLESSVQFDPFVVITCCRTEPEEYLHQDKNRTQKGVGRNTGVRADWFALAKISHDCHLSEPTSPFLQQSKLRAKCLCRQPLSRPRKNGTFAISLDTVQWTAYAQQSMCMKLFLTTWHLGLTVST